MTLCLNCGAAFNYEDADKHVCVVIPLGKELKQGILSDIQKV